MDSQCDKHSIIGMRDIKALEQPANDGDIKYFPRYRVGEGKTPDLEAARHAANWPDATLEQLQSEEALTARLDSLLTEFRQAVESAGFQW